MEIKQACDRSAIFAKSKNEVSISFKIKWQEGEVREREILKFVGWGCAIREFGYGGGFGWRNCIS